MERVLRESNKIVLDSNGSTNAPIILPPEAFQRRAPAAQPGQPTPAPAPQSQQSVSAGGAR